jgi:hypothetical protein
MTEDDIRDRVMHALFEHFGTPGSWRGDGKTATFDFAAFGVNGECAAERKLDYKLPGGKVLSHCSDVLITTRGEARPEDGQGFVSIEIKHTSAVTDQFKCRSFDMYHMKQQFGGRVFGVMLFARAGHGIGLEQARAISYPFDIFVGVDTLSTPPQQWWQELMAAVERGLNRLAGN